MGDTLLLGKGEQEEGALICSHVGAKSLSAVLGIKQVCAFTDHSYRAVGETRLRQGPRQGPVLGRSLIFTLREVEPAKT